MNITQYKCPNCGGDLKFDPKTGLHTCEYCKSKFTIDVLDKQTQSKQSSRPYKEETVSADYSDAEKSSTKAADGSKAEEEAVVYSCPSCGANIVTDSTTAATFCYYCHNPVVLSGRLEGSYKPDYIVPFKIDREKALEIFESWISKKKYVPNAFYSQDQIDKFTGVYFPYLLYSCDIIADLDTNADIVRTYDRGSYSYTDTNTYHVKRDGVMEVKHVMRNALKKANAALSDGVLPFTIDDIKPFNMSYLSGFFAEKRDIDPSELDTAVKEEVNSYGVEKLAESVSEYSGINVTPQNIKLKNGKWEYALMPVWTLTYNDNGKIYYFSVNGQTGKTIGELPVDKGKLFRTFLLIFVPICLALLALFYFVL